MSTCPDSDLYSAWVDGEVPSPWKEKLEDHIRNCPGCKKRAERYRALHSMIAAGFPSMPDMQLEASFARLCAKRDSLAAAGGHRSDHRYPVWTHMSIRIPLPALAAMLAVAVCLPVWLISRGVSSNNAPAPAYTILPAIRQSGIGSGGVRAISTSTPVYSPDLPLEAISDNMIDANNQQYFTMLKFARQFATDKNLFSDGEIIIIKLPSLTRFNNSDETLFKNRQQTFGQAAGFYK